jgi:hypothetical protein
LSLKVKKRDLITRAKKGTLSEASVYFRQLNGGPWFGINEDTMFTPGSLLKVPLIMSVYMKAEKDPTLLTKTILFEGGSALATERYTSEQIEVGKIYSVEDSDNNATLL